MDKPVIDALIDDCRSGIPERQIDAIIQLIKLHALSAASVLVELLASPDQMVRVSATRALGYLGQAEIETVGPALTHELSDPDVLIRNQAIESLGTLGYKPALEDIKQILHKDPEWLIRASAAEALGNFQDATLLVDLESALHDEYDEVRAYAALSIGLIGTSAFLPTLSHYIDTEASPEVKIELLIAGYRLGDVSRLQEVFDMLKTADEDIASRILTSLQDLIEWEPPLSLQKDAPRIREALMNITQRFPLYQVQAQNILSHLTSSADEQE